MFNRKPVQKHIGWVDPLAAVSSSKCKVVIDYIHIGLTKIQVQYLL